MKEIKYIDDEVYASIDLAVRIKDLGYKRTTYTYYESINNDKLYTGPCKSYNTIEYISGFFGNKIPVSYISAPTLSAVQNWMRKNFDCIVESKYNQTLKSYEYFIYIQNKTINNYANYSSYEEALEKGLIMATEYISLRPISCKVFTD